MEQAPNKRRVFGMPRHITTAATTPTVLILNEMNRDEYQPHSSTRAHLDPSTSSVFHCARTFPSNSSVRASVQPVAPLGSRILSGDACLNYESFGSLRPEFVPIRLFSTAFLGLAVNAMAAGFVITLSKYGFRQLLGEYLRVRDDSYATSIAFLFEWPGSFSLLLGFLSDCRPIGGRRRKPYMLIGWLVAFVIFLLIALLDFTLSFSWGVLDWRQPPSYGLPSPATSSRVARYGALLLALSLLARLAVQLMYIASLSMTVEFAQREALRDRGKLQATYFVLFYVMAAVAQAVSTSFVLADETGHVRAKLSVGWVSLILAVACLLPVPVIVAYLDEPTVDELTIHFSVRSRIRELWVFCQQNVVVRLLAFLIIHFFLIGLYNKNARAAVASWCRVTENQQPLVNAVSAAGYCVSLVVWIRFMVNWSWPRIAGVGTVVFILGYVTFTALVVFDVVRNDWFYILMVGALDMPVAWIRLYAVVLSTEIADVGREGAAMGLVYAAQLMVGVSAHMLSAAVGDWLPFHVTAEQVLADSAHTRAQVFRGAMALFATNCLALLVVLALPQQKLDAQQLRAFGGRTLLASVAVAGLVSLLFSANFVMNALALTK